MKHGFLITAHRDPDQLFELMSLLESTNHYFYVNIDRKMSNYKAIAKYIKSQIPNSKFTHMEVSHGGYTQIECTLNLLKLAAQDNLDYYHLISGQDFICQSNSEFDNYFENANGKSFMLYDNEEQHNRWIQTKYQKRTRCWYFNDVKHRDFYIIDIFVKLLNKISCKILWRNKIEGLRAGWNWFSWNSQVVEYVLKEKKENPKFFNRFKHTSCCDEVLFHTLLYPKLKELNIDPTNSLRYVNWVKIDSNRKMKNSPLILNEEEYDDIIKSKAFFCRKVDKVISKKLTQVLRDRISNGI